MNVLNIASLLPYKNREVNDIIIKNSEYINEYSKNNYNFKYLTLLPYSNKLLSFFKEDWKKYYNYPTHYYFNGNLIYGIQGMRLPKSIFMKLTCLSYIFMNRDKIKRLIQDIDMVHAHYLFPDGYLAYYIYKKHGIPYVVTVRRNSSKWLTKNYFLKATGKKILNNARKIISVNVVDKNRVQHILNKEIQVIPHSIKNESFYENFQVNDKINIITVAHFQKVKRINLVIKALAELNKKGYENQYSYTVVGENKDNLNLKGLADKLKVNVNFTGKLSFDKTQELLKESDIFVLPSVNETFGRVYSEAVSKSNATLAVKNTGIYGFFTQDEVIYLKKDDLEGLVHELKSLLDNKRKIKDMKIKSYIKAKKIFLLENNINDYINIYNKVLRRS